MAIQTARQGGLEVSVNSPDSKRFIKKSGRGKVFVGYSLVDVGVEYTLPQGVTGAKLGTPTAVNSDGQYKVPVIWANGSGIGQNFRQYGTGKRPDKAEQFIVVPYAGSPTGHKLLYLTKQ